MDAYEFLLDFFPLVEEISAQNAVLGATLQSLALTLIEHEEPRDQIRLLLQLSADLGYCAPEVVDFLEKSLTRA